MERAAGLVIVNVRARLPVLKGQLVNESCREEPVCLKYSEGFASINIWSSSACVEGRARQNERLGLWSEQLVSSS